MCREKARKLVLSAIAVALWLAASWWVHERALGGRGMMPYALGGVTLLVLSGVWRHRALVWLGVIDLAYGVVGTAVEIWTGSKGPAREASILGALAMVPVVWAVEWRRAKRQTGAQPWQGSADGARGPGAGEHRE